MTTLLIRMIAAALIAVIFALQAHKAQPRSSRQLAFGVSAAAFVLFALTNGLTIIYLDPNLLQIITMIGIALLAVSLMLMVRAYSHGEMGDKLRRAREMIAEERSRTKQR
ncbi:hypothetical protein [Candidatus Oscillochloris fontis]|uniref:hypothetical protein n=1 Tax=Candidatus Oscillochloris fontis TaxID=2496868 RepID=UPI00101CE11A|nr:hypothetical protein [Candidatus Oscillochloris fontis]